MYEQCKYNTGTRRQTLNGNAPFLRQWDSKTHISLNDFANGLYHYEVEFANMKKTIGKFIILK
jgi:hypothetical protein